MIAYRRRLHLVFGAVAVSMASAAVAMWPDGPKQPSAISKPLGGGQTDAVLPYVALGFDDWGMRVMNPDYADIMILPPGNNLHVQLIKRGNNPDVVTDAEFTVRYSFPNNTHSSDKSNFWAHPQPLLGPAPLPDLGLTGHGLVGTLAATPDRDWLVTGIPLTSIDDTGRENPYPLAVITVERNNQVVAQTRVVVPVSNDINCNLCHQTPQISTAQDNLLSHDTLHNTTLLSQRPVLCASCHADTLLGQAGQPGIASLSSSMHTAHAPRMSIAALPNECYACHPGVRTEFQRDIHKASNIECKDCHGDMLAVGSPARTPWVDEPRCANCHARQGFEFEQPGKLFKNSIGHGGVHCGACHGSPHAITPTTTEVDNVQANLYQGHAGTINTCLVCHTVQPTQAFFHRVEN